MTWKEINGVIIKDGFYLEPVAPHKIAFDTYTLTGKILNDRGEKYTEKKPLLLPLMRGGSQMFLYMSGGFRKLLCTKQGEEIDYVPIKISRYGTGTIGLEGKPKVDEIDIEQTLEHLKRHNEAIIIDDIFDRGESTDTVQKMLLETGKEILIATPYRKPYANRTSTKVNYFVEDFNKKTIEEKEYKPWVVFPWEVDDHDPDLWKRLFPQFYYSFYE